MSTRRVAVVTGASSNIGRAIALRLADEGFDLTINSSEPYKLYAIADMIRQKGRKVIIVVGDVSDESVAENIVTQTVRDLGTLDVMVANAGIEYMDSILDRAASAGALSASKFAIRGLTQSAAREYRKYGITVNAYAPGFMDTPVLGMFNGNLSDHIQVAARRSTVQRIGQPNDIANIVSFLASDKSASITGQAVQV
ncbi:hypothetical protein AMATHDRAFT_4952 [Amanita thiersii Skay4041]|uniref:Ketoreductase (KR) domain-containing protein n=1 Tax=Amanita thiersii Skay4041 TaxID=703135 RepID=A0A2A9NNW9_9AGAR|nr:hypothetical protein AMATHDRAFT_4952 [Amanita thiersii Skay4041]